jgi:hypothetical protein
MNSLTWDDLFIDASQVAFDDLLQEWPGLITGQIRPIGASVFGDLFFERRSGEVGELDVLEGEVRFVADNFDLFSTLMNTQEWQEQNLLSQGVALLKERGATRAPGQFFALPHIQLSPERSTGRG